MALVAVVVVDDDPDVPVSRMLGGACEKGMTWVWEHMTTTID